MPRPFKPAKVFPPGDFIKEELAERGWTQSQLARIIGRPIQAVNEIVNGRKRITAATAKALGVVFDTGPELWLNLENTYRLSVTPDADPMIAKRAAAFS